MDARDAKRAANKASYAKAKPRQEAALLRLEKGDLARLDAACSATGLSRSAFATLYLLPAAEAMSTRLGGIDAARAALRISLTTFLHGAIDEHLNQISARVPSGVADEFDSLFGAKEDRC